VRITTLAVGLGMGIGLWLLSLAAIGWMERSLIPLATTSRQKSTRKWPGLRWLSSVLQPGSIVTIRVGVDAPLFSTDLLPGVLGADTMRVTAESTRMVSRYGVPE